MFHLALGLTALSFSLAFLAIIAIPLWLGPTLQIIVTVFCKRRVYLLIPFFLGVLLAIVSVLLLWETVAFVYLILYWCAYALLLLLAFGIVRGIQSLVKR